MVAHLTEVKSWTYEDYLRLEDDKRYEIIDGELREMTPAPSTGHQACVRELAFLFLNYVCKQQEGREVFFSPIDVILSEANVVQPDIVLVRTDRREIIRERGIFGAPDLVVEVVSPSSVHNDYLVKKALYERFGVQEYWIVDPANRSIDVLVLEENQYRSVCFISETGTAASKLLAGFQVDLGAIFGRE